MVRAAWKVSSSWSGNVLLWKEKFRLTMEDGFCEELEDLVHFSVHDLPARGYVVMEEIRRLGKLCDVTLKVRKTP